MKPALFAVICICLLVQAHAQSNPQLDSQVQQLQYQMDALQLQQQQRQWDELARKQRELDARTSKLDSRGQCFVNVHTLRDHMRRQPDDGQAAAQLRWWEKQCPGI